MEASYQITGFLRRNYKQLLKEGLDVQMIKDNNATVDFMITLRCPLDVFKLFYAGKQLGVEQEKERSPKNLEP